MIEDFTGFSDLANLRGFFVTYLHYVGPPPTYSWNYFMDPAKPDDIGYAKAVIDTMFARYPIDSSRVYAAGFSDGCGMANRLALETDGLIKATGTVAAMQQFDAGVETQPVKMVHIHARYDPSVSFAPIRNTILNYWLDVNGCENPPDTLLNDRGYITEAWTNAEDDTAVLFYTIPWGLHAWPVIDGSHYADATEIIWGFFNGEIILPELPPVENVEEFMNDSGRMKVFPNPSFDRVSLLVDMKSEEHLVMQIFQTDGRQISSVDIGLSSQGINRFDLDISDLPSNYYILRIVGDTFISSENLVVY